MNAGWYIVEGERCYGPFSIEQLKKLDASGILQASDLVWDQTDNAPQKVCTAIKRSSTTPLRQVKAGAWKYAVWVTLSLAVFLAGFFLRGSLDQHQEQLADSSSIGSTQVDEEPQPDLQNTNSAKSDAGGEESPSEVKDAFEPITEEPASQTVDPLVESDGKAVPATDAPPTPEPTRVVPPHETPRPQPSSVAQPTPRPDPQVLRGHSAYVTCLDYSSDGTWLVSGSNDRTVRLWNARSGATEWTSTAFTSNVLLVRFTPAGDKIWVCSQNEVVALRKNNGTRITSTPIQASIGSTFNDSCTRLYALTGGNLAIFDLGSQRRVDNIKKWATRVAVDRSGQKLLFGGFDSDKAFDLWEIPSKRRLKQSTETLTAWTCALVFSQDQTHFIHATGPPAKGASDSPRIRLFNTRSGRQEYDFGDVGGWQWAVAFSPDSRLVAMGGGGSANDWYGHGPNADTSIRLWDVSTRRLKRTFTGHRAGIYCVCFSPDGKRLASGSSDNTIRLWNVDQ